MCLLAISLTSLAPLVQCRLCFGFQQSLALIVLIPADRRRLSEICGRIHDLRTLVDMG